MVKLPAVHVFSFRVLLSALGATLAIGAALAGQPFPSSMIRIVNGNAPGPLRGNLWSGNELVLLTIRKISAIHAHLQQTSSARLQQLLPQLLQ